MITLYSAPTPNGWKASIALEEMGLPYELRVIKLNSLEQKEPWFLKINPNGRIPAIVDHDNKDFPVFESGAIMLYLAEKTGKFLPTDREGRSRVIQWLMFQMSGVGPMQGQVNVFLRYAPEKIPYAIERYTKETLRLYGVMDAQLANHEYIAGEYSIADMALFPWVRIAPWAGLTTEGLPNLERWMERLSARPAVQKGMMTPPHAEPAKMEEWIKKFREGKA